MRVASISDLHLGQSPALDGFGGSEFVLLQLLDRLERDHDHIILLGDIFATDYGRRPGSSAEVLHRTLQRYRATARRWREAPYTLVFGNHDPITEKELGAREHVELEHRGFRARWQHGHQFDPLLGPHAPLTTWAIGGLRRAGAQGLANLLEGPVYERGLDIAARFGPSLAAGAGEMVGRDEADAVIMGHTHQTACRAMGEGVYANAGATTAAHLSWVSVDLANREVRVCKLDGGKVRELAVWQSPAQGRPDAQAKQVSTSSVA